jgi:hypothetical protein
MGNLQLHWTEAELLETDRLAEPLIAGGLRCHGGFDADGAYVSPRTRFRAPAIRGWQQHHTETFGAEILDAPLEQWPEPYPNVAQSKYLLREGVRLPTITTLTRVGTVEGFGGLIRGWGCGDVQPNVVESIDGTALAHLQSGLFEAHARDETGYGDEIGHKEMWFVARDVAFETPCSPAEIHAMLQRAGFGSAAGGTPPPQATLEPVFADLDQRFEAMLRRMIGLLFIEVSAFHVLAWAAEVLGDEALVAGDGEAAKLVAYIRADETPHVEYLRTALTELRDRTLVGTNGKTYAGHDVIGTLWDRALAESLGPNRANQRRSTLAEIDFALMGNKRRDTILDEFHALASPQHVAAPSR